MPDRGRGIRRAARCALVATAAFLTSPVVAAHAAPTSPPVPSKVTIRVLSVSPTTPAITPKTRRLTITLSLTNVTNAPLKGIAVEGVRAAPVNSPTALAAAIAAPQAPDPGSAQPITTKQPVTLDLDGGATETVEISTTTSITDGAAGICLCTSAGVYPLYFTASIDGVVVGSDQTYLPAFYQVPQTEQVTWLWPMLDRPHRLTSDTVFTDDDLANSINGGRLDRALQTLEDLAAIAPNVPLTIVLDPEILDELLVMADLTTPYTVHAAGKPVAPGTGAAAAVAWLQRLRSVLDQDPAITIALTPFADPDLETVVSQGLTLSAMPPASTARISAWLGTRVPLTNLAWPVSGAISPTTASSLVTDGLTTVVAGPAAVAAAAVPTNGGARSVATDAGDLSLLSTTKQIDTTLVSAVSIGGSTEALQQLVAEVAVRVAQDPTVGQHVVLAPPRYLDPSPQAAAAAIAATTATFWSAPQALPQTVPTFGRPLPAARLLGPQAGAPALGATTIDTAQTATEELSALQSLFVGTTPNPQLAVVATAIQRIESAAWAANPRAGKAFAELLSAYLDKITHGVFILNPAGTYTLASSNSPLPLTIENDNDYAVRVRVEVTTVNRLPGFTAKPLIETVAAHSKLPIHVPTTVERSGRIQVQAQLRTLSGSYLGAPVTLSVRSTALGRIGLIITVVSGAVLVLALLRRFWYRLRRRRTSEVPTSVLAASEPPR